MASEKERFEILLEEVRDKVQLVSEGHGTIRNEMRQMEERLSEKISLVDGKVDFLGAEVRGIKTELKEVKKKVDKIDHTLEEHVRLPVHAGAN